MKVRQMLRGQTKRNAIRGALAAAIAALICAVAWGQSTSVTGKVLDKSGAVMAGVQVVYTATSNGRVFKVKTDKNGEFAMMGVPSGSYQVEVIGTDGQSLYKGKINLTDAPESRRQLIEFSKAGGATPSGAASGLIDAINAQNAEAQAQNTIIMRVNVALLNKDWANAAADLKKLIEMNPQNWQCYGALGNAQVNLGQYEDAVQNYEKGARLALGVTEPKELADKARAAASGMMNSEGVALVKLKRNVDAAAAFQKAASLNPNPGLAYFNLCVTYFNTGFGYIEAALDACGKAIAADPTRADAYFIKGSLLLAQGSLNSEGKYVAPPGTAEALKKYLELAPNGPHAYDVKQMLETIGEKVPPLS